MPWWALLASALCIAGIVTYALKGSKVGSLSMDFFDSIGSSKEGFVQLLDIYNMSFPATLGAAGGVVLASMVMAICRINQKLRKDGKTSKSGVADCSVVVLFQAAGSGLHEGLLLHLLWTGQKARACLRQNGTPFYKAGLQRWQGAPLLNSHKPHQNTYTASRGGTAGPWGKATFSMLRWLSIFMVLFTLLAFAWFVYNSALLASWGLGVWVSAAAPGPRVQYGCATWQHLPTPFASGSYREPLVLCRRCATAAQLPLRQWAR